MIINQSKGLLHRPPRWQLVSLRVHLTVKQIIQYSIEGVQGCLSGCKSVDEAKFLNPPKKSKRCIYINFVTKKKETTAYHGNAVMLIPAAYPVTCTYPSRLGIELPASHNPVQGKLAGIVNPSAPSLQSFCNLAHNTLIFP